MKLFTYILDFRGGTYISQVLANSIDDSLETWIMQLEKEIDEIKYIGCKTLNQIRELKKTGQIDKPMKLIGLKNVWYNEIFTTTGVLRINIVLTSYD